jgi:hypothetical protein
MRMYVRQSVGGVVRSPKQLAKAAMKQAGVRELQKAGLDTEIRLSIEYMGQRHTLTGRPTVKLETGQIGFYAAGNGPNRVQFNGSEKVPLLSFSVGCNVGTGNMIEDWRNILQQHGLAVPTEEDLDAGESTD